MHGSLGNAFWKLVLLSRFDPVDGAALPFRAIIRAALLVIVPVVLSTAIAVLVALQMSPIYAAEAEIVFDPSGRPDVLEKYQSTQAVIVKSRVTLLPVSQATDIPIEDLEDSLRVEFAKGSMVMSLRYSDHDAKTALRVVSSVLDNYLASLDQVQFLGTAQQVLVPPFILNEPIWPKPLQAGAIGAVAGLAIGIAALALVQAARALG